MAESHTGRLLRMSHKEALEAGADCQSCHGSTIIRGEDLNPGMVMELCLRCHDSKTASNDCKRCHVSDWVRQRAEEEKQNLADLRISKDPSFQCYDCHDPKPCDSCHGVRMPHTKEFMSIDVFPVVHGIYSRRNGTKACFKCHTEKGSPLGAGNCYACHLHGTL